jgi:hypothetical protein
LLLSMWPTFPIVPKSVNQIITTSPINKFTFHASLHGWKFKQFYFLSFVKSWTKRTWLQAFSLALYSFLSTNVYG